MAGISIAELLQPQVILREVSRVNLPGTVLADLFMWGLKNRDPEAQDKQNCFDYQLRKGSYDIFNQSKKVVAASVPGSAASEMAPNPVGSVDFTIPRAATQMSLTDESLVNQRQIGQAVTIVDSMGQNYILRQKQYMASQYANMIEFQTAAMLRGSYTWTQVGTEFRHAFSGGDVTVNFQVPAGNKNQLDMLGNGDIIDASWATTSTDIPKHCLQINEASNALSGMGIEHAICNSKTWNYIINNTKVQAQAGTANTPYEEYNRVGNGRFSVRLRAIPWLMWHIIDYALDIWNGSAFVNTKLIADDQVNFIPTPSPLWTQYINGGETVTEGPNGVREFRQGFYSYGYPTHNPSGWSLNAVHNGIPACYVPSAIVCADVTP